MAAPKTAPKKPRVEKVITTDVEALKQTVAQLKPGMTIRLHQKIKELNTKNEEKERLQYFEGIIIAIRRNKNTGGTMTIRKVSDGVGVEKIYPLNLPTITKIEIKKQAEVRRAKLYYLRNYKKKLSEKKVS